jgi:solute carrier family 25 S-adenosylmethionine transporter 26
VALYSGAAAGAATEAVLFPLDCLKTRAQAKGVTKTGTMRGIYRGLGVGIASAAPGSAVFFTVYELSSHALRGSDASGYRHLGASVLASVLGELVASGVRAPADMVKQRLQAGVASSFWDAAKVASWRGIVASWRATAMRDVLHSSLQFPLYEGLKLALAHQTGRRTSSIPAWQAAVCGSVAGASSAYLTTPLDLLRTRVNLRSPASAAAGQALSLRQLASEEIKDIYRHRGVTGFFAGAGYRASCMGLGGFVFLGAFETTKTFFTGSFL